MWVVLVRYKDGTVNVSQEAYKTYQEAKAEIVKKDNIKTVTDYIYYGIENELQYEIKTVYIK